MARGSSVCTCGRGGTFRAVSQLRCCPPTWWLDASGRGSRGASWLAELDFAPPPETVVDAALGYASRCYARPDGWRADWTALLVQATPPGGTRGGALIPIEGERWLATLAGAAQDYPPTDEAGFVAFARSLPTPLLADAIAGARPLGPIFGSRRTENRLRRCEAVPRWPAGFLILGDAACAFNPVYGQGMTVCAEEALVLDHCLRDRRPERPEWGDGPAQRFQRDLAGTHEPAGFSESGFDFCSAEGNDP
jgi:2-polyprenyl-6-methoxyphenol hydroxylase-like FAD-dependent oxidoreductase